MLWKRTENFVSGNILILGDVDDHLPSICLSMVMVVKLSGEIAFYSPWYIKL